MEITEKGKETLRIVVRVCFLSVAFVLLLCSCSRIQPGDAEEALVKVKDRILYKSEIRKLVPAGLPSADSLLLAENFAKKWTKDVLVYDQASKNLGSDKEHVEQLVEAYRKSLIRSRYQERLISEKFSVDVRESDKLIFYEENQGRFLLDRSLIKGLFLKVPADAPGLGDLKKWYKTNSEESLEKIEKYSIQNASIYEYFYDKWIGFDEVAKNMPLKITDVNSFLRANKAIEVSDSNFCYLLNIQEYILVGKVAPYEYVESQVVEILTNQRKKDFLEKFENELYINSVKKGEVRFFEP